MDSAKIVMQDFYKHISKAEAILVGAGSGMSAAAGFRHYYERDKDFIEVCGDFEKKYVITIPSMASIIHTERVKNAGRLSPG